MKKVYNYITIVKEGNDLKLGKNCGISCNRRNAMDKAHGRKRQIIAAINLLNPFCDKSPEQCIEMVQAMLSARECNLLKMPLETITTFIAKTAIKLGYAEKCITYIGIPTKWSY